MKLEKLTIHKIHDLLKNKEVSYSEVAESVLNQIETQNETNGAYLYTDPDAVREQAEALDKNGTLPENPLFGIPFGLKDNFCTDNMPMTCASKMLENFKPPYNATAYERIKNAGGVLLGKTNMDEFAMGSSTETSYFKVTKNPWDLTKVPGGSSGGSAAAVAADMAYYTLGTDTGGSIRQPSSFCATVGLKPTYGLVSRYGVTAFASSFDQVGPITKDVTDCALVLNTITGHDVKDTTSLELAKKDYTLSLTKDIKGLKIGISDAFMGENLQPEVRAAIDNAVTVYRELGAEIVPVCAKCLDHALAAYYIISSAEASTNMSRYDGVRYGYRAEDYRDLEDMYIKTRTEGFGTEVKRRIILGSYVLSSGYYDAYYNKAMRVRTMIREDFNRIFESCDVLLTPTTATTAFGIGERSDDPLAMYLTDVYTVPANIVGAPALSLPCGFDDSGMPIGLQLMGPLLCEETILKAAYAFESETDFHTQQPKNK